MKYIRGLSNFIQEGNLTIPSLVITGTIRLHWLWQKWMWQQLQILIRVFKRNLRDHSFQNFLPQGFGWIQYQPYWSLLRPAKRVVGPPALSQSTMKWRWRSHADLTPCIFTFAHRVALVWIYPCYSGISRSIWLDFNKHMYLSSPKESCVLAQAVTVFNSKF